MTGSLTHNQLVAQIAASGSVEYAGVLYTPTSVVPDDATLAAAWNAVHGVTAPILKSRVAAVAPGGSLTIWTPTTGKRWRLRSLRVAVDAGDITTPYELYDGATLIAYGVDQGTFTLVLWLDFPAPGYLSATPDNTFTIKNTQVGTASILCIAVGDEL